MAPDRWITTAGEWRRRRVIALLGSRYYADGFRVAVFVEPV